MPKRNAPKIVNQEIIKAIQYLTNRDRYVTVTISDIVERVRLRVNDVGNIKNPDDTIKDAIYKLRDLGLIGYIGHNQYCCAECFAIEAPMRPTPQPTPKPGQPDPAHFKQNSQRKSILEKKSSLDPNRKHRNSDDASATSHSGDEYERTRKRFYGMKKIIKVNPNTPLPGARQTNSPKTSFLDVDSESTSKDSQYGAGAMEYCRYLSKRIAAGNDSLYDSDEPLCSEDLNMLKSNKRRKLSNTVEVFEENNVVPAGNDLQSDENVSIVHNETTVDDNSNENEDTFESTEEES